MKILAIKVNFDHYLYSRANHDFRSLDGYSVDAGPGVGRILYPPNTTCPKPQWIEVKGVTYADIYNDWNYRVDKYGIHPINKVTILEEKDYPDFDSFEWKVETAMWKTYGKNGDEPGKMIMLKNAEKEHLTAILETQSHISAKTRKIIKHILKERVNEQN